MGGVSSERFCFGRFQYPSRHSAASPRGRESAVVIQLLFYKTLNGEIKLLLLLMLPAKTRCRSP
jgi:hypothetical protein